MQRNASVAHNHHAHRTPSSSCNAMPVSLTTITRTVHHRRHATQCQCRSQPSRAPHIIVVMQRNASVAHNHHAHRTPSSACNAMPVSLTTVTRPTNICTLTNSHSDRSGDESCVGRRSPVLSLLFGTVRKHPSIARTIHYTVVC
jgi:hypothetical protein